MTINETYSEVIMQKATKEYFFCSLISWWAADVNLNITLYKVKYNGYLIP